MGKPLESITISAPGFYGLNTQDSGIGLEAGYAVTATNCVIDRFGRLGARKGWQYVTTSGGTGKQILGAHNFTDIDGTDTLISWNKNSFYTGDVTLTPVTDNATAFSTANFDAATLNDKAFFVQAGDEIRYYDPVGGTLEDISTSASAASNPAGIQGANTCLSAYGRLWVADTDTDKTRVYWSDLLDGTNFGTGSAGSIDLSSILVRGNDKVIAMAAHVGRLIVFCKNSTIIFGDTDADQVLDPVNMQLIEVISGVGCPWRDTVHNTGSDVVFLANDGLRSLGRLVQEKSQPMRDISRNVRDELIRLLEAVGQRGEIKAVYNARLAFYLLLFPEYDKTYVFDMQNLLPNGGTRVTTWDMQTHANIVSVREKLYFMQTDGIAEYTGYTDNGSVYRLKYYTVALDFSDSTKTKYVKRVAATVIGGTAQPVVFKVSGSYGGSFKSYTEELLPATLAEYGVAEYNTVWQYNSDGISVEELRVPAGQSGEVLQFGFEADIDGVELSLQKLSIYVKQGRTY